MFKYSKAFTFTIFSVLLTMMSFSSFAAKKVTVGFSIDDLRVERWTKDRDYFVEAVEAEGARVKVLSANGNEATQISQIETLITQGVDVLVIVPFNGNVLNTVIKEAQEEGIKVIAYDRMIHAPIDLYISFDNFRVGEMQAQSVYDVTHSGNYYMVNGSKLDNNAFLFHDGARKVLDEHANDVNIVGEQWAKDWLPEEAIKIAENALTANDNDIQAFVVANDGLAGGVIQALYAQGLEGKVAVSGQDADIAGLKRVIEGTQTSTIYKPLQGLAQAAAKSAVALARGEKVETNAVQTTKTGLEIPSILLDPILITKDNVNVVIEKGAYTAEELGL